MWLQFLPAFACGCVRVAVSDTRRFAGVGACERRSAAIASAAAGQARIGQRAACAGHAAHLHRHAAVGECGHGAGSGLRAERQPPAAACAARAWALPAWSSPPTASTTCAPVPPACSVLMPLSCPVLSCIYCWLTFFLQAVRLQAREAWRREARGWGGRAQCGNMDDPECLTGEERSTWGALYSDAEPESAGGQRARAAAPACTARRCGGARAPQSERDRNRPHRGRCPARSVCRGCALACLRSLPCCAGVAVFMLASTVLQVMSALLT